MYSSFDAHSRSLGCHGILRSLFQLKHQKEELEGTEQAELGCWWLSSCFMYCEGLWEQEQGDCMGKNTCSESGVHAPLCDCHRGVRSSMSLLWRPKAGQQWALGEEKMLCGWAFAEAEEEGWAGARVLCSLCTAVCVLW